MDIQGHKFLVTGGASGMGRNFTLNLAKLGGDVAFCDLNEEAIAEVEAEGAELPGKVVGFKANVASEDDVVALIKRVCVRPSVDSTAGSTTRASFGTACSLRPTARPAKSRR